MKDQRANLILLIALLASIAVHWSLRPAGRRPVGFFPLSNMDRSPAAGSFEPRDELPGGQVQQPPPAGTVPRGWSNAAPAIDDAALARGETVYRTFCAVCHGPAGAGDGRVTQRGVPAPPSLLGDNAMTMSDQQMYDILTAGQKTMPAYAAQIEPADRWRVIAFVRRLQQPAAPASQP